MQPLYAAYSLSPYYDPKVSPLEFETQSDDTYNVFLNIPEQDVKKTFIYHTEPADLSSFDVSYVNKRVIQSSFFYKNNQFPTQTIYADIKSHEISSPYPYQSTIYSKKYNLMVTANDPNNTQYIILQPIFTSQSKVWILIERDFRTTFPNADQNYPSTFFKAGELFLVTSEDAQFVKSELEPVVTKSEIIPIDYSIFEKQVSQPTCYAMPEDHKLRLCTADEEKLRTSALKVFLGESK